jgi:hypothetical protein
MRLLPYLRRAGERLAKSGSRREARVVMVASKLHEIGAIRSKDPQLLCEYSAASAYGQSKLAQVGGWGAKASMKLGWINDTRDAGVHSAVFGKV